MKILLSFLTFSLSVSVAIGQPGPLNLSPVKVYTVTALGMHGRVKTVTEKTYLAKTSGYDQGSTEISQFDSEGRLTEKKNLLMFSGMSMGTVIEKYSYDPKGRLVKISISDESGKADEFDTFVYDAKGSLTEMAYTAPTDKTKEKYEYDVQGRMTVKKNFRAAAKTPYLLTRYSYDAQNRRITDETENTETKKRSTVRYTYAGNNLQPKTSNYEGEMDYSFGTATGTAYEYNSTGDISTTSAFNASGKVSLRDMKYMYEYDKEGNWTKVTHTGFGAGYKTRVIEYYPPAEKPETKYKNAVVELAEPPMEAFGKLVQSASEQNSVPAPLLNDQKAMLLLAQTNLVKLKAITDLPGNTSKQLAIKFLEYLIAPATTKQVQSIIKKEGDYTAALKDIATKVKAMRSELQGEFKKLQ